MRSGLSSTPPGRRHERERAGAKDMDQRDFAEYVVIGTLLSVTGAVLVAEAVNLLLS